MSDGPARLRLPKNDQRYGYDCHPGETSGRKENTYQLGNVFTFIANRHSSCPYTLTTSRWLDREKVGLVCGKSSVGAHEPTLGRHGLRVHGLDKLGPTILPRH